jgi:hypothetical protein
MLSSPPSFKALYPDGHPIKAGDAWARALDACQCVCQCCHPLNMVCKRSLIFPAFDLSLVCIGAVPFSFPHVGWASRQEDPTAASSVDIKVLICASSSKLT